ncbi:hypothetical protein LJC18_03900 [Lachnospiraceae bacterium OttesenSCG-928-E19]|nr:hypothetical protein [Lachnospiraceae bacterium OttesenSCG-928-E19]
MKMQSFLRGVEEPKIEGTYFFQTQNKQVVAASFPVGAVGFDKFGAYTVDSGKRVEGLLCKPNVIKESGGTFNECSFPIFD